MTACYQDILPTRVNPAGKRAYVLNVHTKQAYRGQGIATQLMTMLLEESRRRGVMEVTLDYYEYMVRYMK